MRLEKTNAVALQIWNLMKGELDWSALGVLAEYYRVGDIELLIDSLLHIKDYQDKTAAQQ